MSKETQERKFIVFFLARSWHSPELEEGRLWASEAGPWPGGVEIVRIFEIHGSSLKFHLLAQSVLYFSFQHLGFSLLSSYREGWFIAKKRETMEVSRGRIWLSRQPDSQASVLLTADSSTLSTQGRLSLPGPFLQIFQRSLLGPGGLAFQSPLKLPRVHDKEVIMVPGERIYASSNLARSPKRTWCLCGRKKILILKQREWTEHKLVHEDRGLREPLNPLYHHLLQIWASAHIAFTFSPPGGAFGEQAWCFSPETASKLKRTVTTESIPHPLTGCLSVLETQA